MILLRCLFKAKQYAACVLLFKNGAEKGLKADDKELLNNIRPMSGISAS